MSRAEANSIRAGDEAPEPPPFAPTRDSPLVFPLQDTLRRLREARSDPAGPFATQIELGHPALATMAVYMMRLEPHVRTAPYRTTANSIYVVVEGAGATIVDGERFEWRRGDVVAAPAWRPHWHAASGAAILFRATDEPPVMRRFGWWREEAAAAVAIAGAAGQCLRQVHRSPNRSGGT